MLSDIPIASSYRSDRQDILHDFYVPCLGQASHYSRAVGYFTSSSLSLAAKGLHRLIANGGRMRLVASPALTPEDIDALQAGYDRREEILTTALLRELHRPMPDPVAQRLECLAWLIAEGRLDIKIALVSTLSGIGIYHEKIGIFTDDVGNHVVFTGSANESYGGLVSNFESIDVFRSWEPSDVDRVETKIADFEALWDNTTVGLKVFAFPEAARKALLDRRSAHPPSTDPEEGIASVDRTSPNIPESITLRRYQKDAVEAWFANQGRGIWRMATGTGKTITALSLVSQLQRAVSQAGHSLVTIVLCPYQHLVAQWADEARRFGVEPVLCFRSHETWFDDLMNRVIAAQRSSEFVMAITTNVTFQGDRFQEVLSRIRTRFLVIGDEAHNLGAPRLRGLLPDNATYRLGLSATPERWYDDEGTDELIRYFGPIVYELDLGHAIGIGALTHYDYHPITVELDEEEFAQYIELTEKIGRLMGAGDSELDDEKADGPLRKLLVRRARLLASASEKLPALRTLMEPLRRSTHNLFYCGDGRVEYAPANRELRQLDAVVHLLGRDLQMSVNSYTAETYIDERSELRRQFADGALQGLVAIRCLDEGIDIPETRRAFILASSSNPRQFIQRRGRILRLAPDKRTAEIFDFLVIPPAGDRADALFNVERRLLRRELQRVILFAQLADNGVLAMHRLLPLRQRYNLLDVG